jgi:hypothetical protein
MIQRRDRAGFAIEAVGESFLLIATMRSGRASAPFSA